MPMVETGIERLPLLPEDYSRYWDWSKGNVDATAEETAAAYNALVNGGLTEEFKAVVWDDLVTVLCEVLEEAGLEFDASYGPREDLDMTYSHELSSIRFNGVCMNIDNFLPSAWSWWFQEDKKGYLGRQRVFGYGDADPFFHGDIVYGHYIIEITEKLNKLIRMLKNTADFAELQFLRDIYSKDRVTLRKLKITESGSLSIIKTFEDVTLKIPGRKQLESISWFNSIHQSSAECKKSFPMYGTALIWSDLFAGAVAKKSLRMRGFGRNMTIYEALLRRPRALKIGRFQMISKTEYIADNYPIRGLVVYPTESLCVSSIKEPSLINRASKKIMVRTVSDSLSSSDAIIVRPRMIAGNGSGYSYEKASSSVLRGKLLFAKGQSKSEKRVRAYVWKSAQIRFSEHLNTGFLEDLRSTPSMRVVGKSMSITQDIATLEFDEIGMNWIPPVQRGKDLYIRQVWSSAYLDGTLHIDRFVWYNPVQEGDDLYIRQAWSAWRQGKELNIDSTEFYRPEQDGGNLYIRSVNRVHADGTNIDIDLDFYLPPIQEGSNLYIRQDFIGGN